MPQGIGTGPPGSEPAPLDAASNPPAPAPDAETVAAMYGATTTKVVECPKTMVGRVIGKGGETIKRLQMQSGANIQIDQKSMGAEEPRKVEISGTGSAHEPRRRHKPVAPPPSDTPLRSRRGRL